MRKLYKSQISLSVNEVYWHTAVPTRFLVVNAALTLPQRSLIVLTKAEVAHEPKIFTLWPFTRKAYRLRDETFILHI